MAKSKKNVEAETAVEALSKTEKFFQNHGKKVVILLIIIVLAVLGYFAWDKFVNEPNKEEAAEKMSYAEEQFIKGSYDIAITGDGEFYGLEQIIQEYGNDAPAIKDIMAGIAELQNGNWELAIEHLKSYEGEDVLINARALACIGHAYVELKDYENALSYFEKAANTADNFFAVDYLLNAGVVAEKLGKDDAALSFYKKIVDQYPGTPMEERVKKYIGRIESK